MCNLKVNEINEEPAAMSTTDKELMFKNRLLFAFSASAERMFLSAVCQLETYAPKLQPSHKSDTTDRRNNISDVFINLFQNSSNLPDSKHHDLRYENSLLLHVRKDNIVTLSQGNLIITGYRKTASFRHWCFAVFGLVLDLH